MRSPVISQLASLQPAADKIAYFGAGGAGALADFPLAARQFLAGGVLNENQTPSRLRGVPAVADSPTDVNTVANTGWYRVGSTTANIPISAFGILLHQTYDASQSWQLYFRGNADEIWSRRRTAGAWGAWTKMLLADAVGATELSYAVRGRISTNGISANANEIIRPGIYYAQVSQDASIANNFPSSGSGVLEVTYALGPDNGSAPRLNQRWTTVNHLAGPETWQRSIYAISGVSNYSPWVKLINGDVNGVIAGNSLPPRLQLNGSAEFTDANLITDTGFYLLNTTATNLPATGQRWMLINLRYTGSQLFQVAHEINGLARVWTRACVNGVWTAWVPSLYGDVNGIIADAGLPTRLRAISERAPATANWLDNIQAFGCVAIDAANVAVVNGPPGAPGGLVITMPLSTTYISQAYYSVSAGGNCRQWQRMRGPSGWNAWQLMSVPILGTVSQSGGVPTGALIERGSNANGEYVRFADGTQICSITNLMIKPSSDSAAGVKTVTWTYPSPFVATPVSSHSIASSAPSVRGKVSSAGGATSANLSYQEESATTGEVFTRAFAIGRWF